jgi:radical SAM protein with 4Fe4S-binding SPASM domain
MAVDVTNDLLAPGPLREIRLDLTTRCNLRCVYCAVSQSTWQGADMPIGLAQRAAALIQRAAANQILPTVHINGHGETTFLSNWMEVCKPLLQFHVPLVMTTNLAKQFSSEEFDVLAQMDTIMVSIDTSDPELTRRMRRKVSLSKIVENIEQIRIASARLHSPSPIFRISCGLYDKNTLDIENLAQFAIAHDMKGVGFWNLSSWSFDKFPYENTDVPAEDRAYPLDDLKNDELRPRLDAIRRAISLLKSNDIEVHVNGDFIDALRSRLEPNHQTDQKTRSHDLPQGMTRDCIDPWSYFEVNTNGDVQPCCAHTAIGNLHNTDLHEILDGPAMRRLREDLLNGTPDPQCANCRLRRPTRPEALQGRIRTLFKDSAEVNYAFRPVRVQALLKGALEDLRAGHVETVWSNVRKALEIDPGIHDIGADSASAVRNSLPQVLLKARFPLTLTWLAGIFQQVKDHESAIPLLKRYLELAPDAPDRDHVLQGIRDAEWSIEMSRRHAASMDEGSIDNESARPLQHLWLWLRTSVRLRTRLRSWLK